MKLYYKDDFCTLAQGDCLEVMNEMAEKGLKFDAIITDPPYGTTACKWDTIIPFDKMWNALDTLRKNNIPILLFGSEPFSSALRMSNIKEFKYDWIWDKVIGVGFQIAKYRPMQRHEIISVFCKETSNYYPIKTKRDKIIKGYATPSKVSPLAYNDKTVRIYEDKHPTSIIEFKKIKNGFHPTQKPVELMKYLIKTYTNEGDTILDFTCGSGTTLVAAKKINRKCYGIELEEKYCEVTKNRLLEIQ